MSNSKLDGLHVLNQKTGSSNSVFACIASRANCISNRRVPRERTLMAKHAAFGPRIDLKRFFKASVDALLHVRAAELDIQTIRHNRSLVERTRIDGALTNRALGDAARALAVLWKI